MRFSIIMPVLNEDAMLEEQLAHLVKQCEAYDYELIVIDGGSEDDTVEVAERYGKVVHSAKGRATQMNNGAKVADGDVLLFLHADTRLPEGALMAIEQTLSVPNVVGGAFRLCFNCDLWQYRIVAWATNMRSRTRTIFTGDQAYFVRASSFHDIGGYPEQPLMEDLEIIKRLRSIGKVVLLSQHVTTSARRHKKVGLWRSIVFMWYLRLLYRWGVSPARLQRMYLDVR